MSLAIATGSPLVPKSNACACAFISLPVCASDGQTYDSDCEMRCESSELNVLYKGPCNSKRDVEKACFCTFELNEVCGTDGRTYGNPCTLGCQKQKQKNLDLLHAGSCKSKRSVDLTKCLCPLRILQEQCGTDGNTYANDCYFECAKSKNNGLELAHEGRCDKGSAK